MIRSDEELLTIANSVGGAISFAEGNKMMRRALYNVGRADGLREAQAECRSHSHQWNAIQRLIDQIKA